VRVGRHAGRTNPDLGTGRRKLTRKPDVTATALAPTGTWFSLSPKRGRSRRTNT